MRMRGRGAATCPPATRTRSGARPFAAASRSRRKQAMNRFSAPDAALPFLRVAASVPVLLVHGLPKAIHYASQLDAIEDPLHFGKTLTLGFAIFAEVVCPLLMIAGIATRLAALPIMLVCVVAL